MAEEVANNDETNTEVNLSWKEAKKLKCAEEFYNSVFSSGKPQIRKKDEIKYCETPSQLIASAANTDCPVCGKSFLHVCNLKSHIRTHTGDRPYVCSHCNAGFKQMGHLQTHLRSRHTGEKPFVCPVENCGKSFHQQGNLNQHHKSCHRASSKRNSIIPNKFSCTQCPSQYTRKAAYQAHLRKIHGSGIALDKPAQEVVVEEEATSSVLKQKMLGRVRVVDLSAHPGSPIILHEDSMVKRDVRQDHNFTASPLYLSHDPRLCTTNRKYITYIDDQSREEEDEGSLPESLGGAQEHHLDAVSDFDLLNFNLGFK